MEDRIKHQTKTNVMTQQNIIIQQLLDNGEVSRNWALKNYISRLGAIICGLNKSGWIISGRWIIKPNGKDYVYMLIKEPIKLYAGVPDCLKGEAKNTFKEQGRLGINLPRIRE